MNACFLFGIGVFDKMEFWVGTDTRNLNNGNEVVDFLSLELEVKACISKCGGEVDDRLADFVNLLLG